MKRINSGIKGMSIQGITATATATTPKICRRVCNTIETKLKKNYLPEELNLEHV